MTRKVSMNCTNMLVAFEGEKLRAYVCPAGVLTIGVGHTGPDVKPGMVITREQSQALLAKDLGRFEQAVNRLCPQTTQNQFDALVSFAFNLGEGALEGSTLRKKHNAGDFAGAKAEFLRWDKANGKPLPGLTKRRTAEAELYGRAS